MTEALTIRLPRSVAGLRVVEAPGHEAAAHGPSTQMEPEMERLRAASAGPPEPSEAAKQQTATLVQLVQTVNTLATRLNDLHQ